MKQKALTIFLIAIVARLAFAFILALRADGAGFLMQDSNIYLTFAYNLLNHGIYGVSIFDGTLVPKNHITPIYPLFLVPFIALGASFFLVAFVQNIITSLTAVVIYILGRRIFSERVAMGAALIFALEPTMLLFSNVILTEALFILPFISALLFLAIFIKNRKSSYLIYAGVLLAVSSLVRPLAFYMIFFVPMIVVLANWRKIPWRAIIVSVALFFLVVSPWLLYNFLTFSSLQFSSTSNLNLYYDNAPKFEKWSKGKVEVFTSENWIKMVGRERYGTVEGDRELGKLAKEFILDNFFQYAIFHTIYTPRLFLHDGYMDVYEQLFGNKTSFSSVSLYHRLIKFDIASIFNSIKNTPTILVPYISKLLLLIVVVLSFLNFFLIPKKNKTMRKISLFFIGFLIFYAFLVSPLGQVRLRFIINPILFFLALDSIRILKSRYGFRFKQKVLDIF